VQAKTESAAVRRLPEPSPMPEPDRPVWRPASERASDPLPVRPPSVQPAGDGQMGLF
jgi:hypothetical protein